MREYLKDHKKVLSEWNSCEDGLTMKEAEERLVQYGRNKLKEGKKVSIFRRFIGELMDPMILILVAAAIISGITSAYSGESYADVIIIMVVVLINGILGVVQESKAEKAIEALQEIAAATSKVLRDGQQMVVKS